MRLRRGHFQVLARALAVCVTIVFLGAGCAVTPQSESRPEDVLDRLLPSAVQIILEHPEGRRFRTGSGVVIASRPKGRSSECFVLTSGHTVSGAIGQKAVAAASGAAGV